MNFKTLKWLFATCIVLAGCGSQELIKPDQTQIDAYIQAHPDLPEKDKSCIYDGRFEIGIKQETLFFLLGEPLLSKKFNNLGLCRKNGSIKRVTAKSL